MKWHTPVIPDEESFKIKHYMGLMAIGSCFTDHIKEKLNLGKFSVLTNPFGILYNPISISSAIDRLNENRLIHSGELFYHEGLYRHPEMHSSVAGTDCGQTVADINSIIGTYASRLLSAEVLMITIGTAYVHVLKASGEIAGNNHKLPASQFERRMLTADEVVLALGNSLHQLRERNPHIHVIFTVSPVRHIKDGLIINAHSKAILLDAVHRLHHQFTNSSYFPSYEVMMDDLREYRFYERDLVHPNQIAVDYIWEKFKEVYFDSAEQQMVDEFSALRQAMQHRLLHPNSAESSRFRQAQYQKILHMKARYPNLHWQEELDYFYEPSSDDSSSSGSGNN